MKYGFIYIWYDRKHRKYYIGRHWGDEHDGYICSSTNMRNNYKNRSADFKRRVVSRVYTNNNDLVAEEQRWLDMASSKGLFNRYYNRSFKAHTPSMRGRKHTDETKAKIRASSQGRQFSDLAKERQKKAVLGRKQTESEKSKRADALRGKKWSWKVKGHTTGMITVVDIHGDCCRINIKEFRGSAAGMYATVNSNEGKRRRGLL